MSAVTTRVAEVVCDTRAAECVHLWPSGGLALCGVTEDSHTDCPGSRDPVVPAPADRCPGCRRPLCPDCALAYYIRYLWSWQ